MHSPIKQRADDLPLWVLSYWRSAGSDARRLEKEFMLRLSFGDCLIIACGDQTTILMHEKESLL